MGADCPMAYEIATPVKLAATKLKTVPVPQMNPPSKSEQVTASGSFEEVRKLHGLAGQRMLHKIDINDEAGEQCSRGEEYRDAVRSKSIALGHERASQRARKAPSKLPETMQMTMLFRVVDRPALNPEQPYALPSMITATMASNTPAPRSDFLSAAECSSTRPRPRARSLSNGKGNRQACHIDRRNQQQVRRLKIAAPHQRIYDVDVSAVRTLARKLGVDSPMLPMVNARIREIRKMPTA